ncbi:hypothetical protein GCM10009854_16120 [Saccharopolyspora halophila]|uniref:N-acetyltransferase domain-containing protein n=1 Tax=Saccharopolyspora halophila TaxID=405551 RepID=A0ABP5SWS1_9PSEU
MADLAALSAPLDLRLRSPLPEAEHGVVRQLVDRRAARRRAAEVVNFLGAHARGGDRLLDRSPPGPAATAQVEDLMTSELHRRRGLAAAVLDTALRLTANAGCGIRFLIADAEDWPHCWYPRRGFAVAGRSRTFERP